jgi:transposase
MTEKIERIVYVMNSRTCKLLENNRDLTTKVLLHYDDYYKACKRAATELRRQLKIMADEHHII